MHQNSETNNDDELEWMGKYGYRFAVNGENVQIIHTPDEFYRILLEKAKQSSKRIVLASLYLGTGELEQKFVTSIYSAAKASQTTEGEPLKIQVLLDCNRGSRGTKNSRTMLLPLLKEFGENVKVALYHTPDLRGFWKKVLPERWNEIVGLAHIKVYIFDDDLIISGANLSDSYFTNRQDRYILFKEVPEITNFYHSLVTAISTMSFELQEDNTLKLHPSNKLHPYSNKDKGTSFKKEMVKRVSSVTPNLATSDTDHHNTSNQHVFDQTSAAHSNMEARNVEGKSIFSPNSNSNNEGRNNLSSSKTSDTWVYPLIQMGTYGIKTDSAATEQFFSTSLPKSKIFLASGYFNLTDHYIDVIVNKSNADFDILTASPKANGFYGGKGVSGAVPDAYTHIAKQFYNKICDTCQQNRIILQEYSNPGWTFHAKGLWYSPRGKYLTSVTFIGSPNFGYRSVYRDLESQLVISTSNKNLQKRLHEEQLSLYAHASPVSKKMFSLQSRKVPLWVTKLTRIIQSFF